MKIISDLIELLKSFELLKYSSKVAFIVMVTCCILLALPESWVPFDINVLRVLLVFSVAVIISFFAQGFFRYLKKKYESYQVWRGYEKIISYLSNKEKNFLKEKYSQDEHSLMIDLTNPMHIRLKTLQIISLGIGLSATYYRNVFPGIIQPWVFELMKKKPKLFETKPISNKEEKSDSFSPCEGFLE